MLIKYFKQQKKLFGLALVFLALVDLVQFFIPLVVKDVVDSIESRPDMAPVIRGGLAIAILGVGVFGFRYAWRVILFKASQRLVTDLRGRLYDRLLSYPQSFYAKVQTGDLMARAVNDLNAVRTMFFFGVIAIFDMLFMGVASIWFMMSLNPGLTFWVILPLAMLVPVVFLFENRIHRAFRRVQELFSDISSLTQEFFTGIFVIKAFHQEGHLTDRFAAKNQEYVSENLRLARLSAMFDPILSLPVAVSTIIALYAGGRAVMGGGFSIGGLVAFTAYLGMLSWPVMALAFAINVYQRGLASLKRIEEITEAVVSASTGVPVAREHGADISQCAEIAGVQTSAEDPEGEGVPPAPPSAGRAAASAFAAFDRVDIDFTRLTFAYDADREVLRDLDLHIPAGQKVGVLGRIGTGKSTLYRVLTRSFAVADGMVWLNGTDINRIDECRLRELVTVVPQEAFLFSTTIGENIAFFNDRVSSQAMARAARLADLESTIEDMPDKYSTLLGERGVNLSGGQKQRVTIARAILKPAPILVFDDCFSAMDIETETTVLQRLEPVLARCTVLLITHRVTAVQSLDRIIIMDDGKVVEDGSPGELLRLDGRYAALWRRHSLERRLSEEA